MAVADLGPYLDDLDRLNAWFGGHALTVRAVRRLVRGERRTRPVVVADVGGARGDLAIRLARDARRRGSALRVVVLDRDEASLALGARAAKPYPEISWVQADAAQLPLRPGAVDVAVTSLTLHHLAPDAVVAALAAMRHAARLGVAVNDLVRSRLALALVWLATRLFTAHPFSRDDGPLSVRRAYAPDELVGLARRAGFTRFAVRRYPALARLVGIGS
ncbi:MAG: methyltransferase domain-containing protein [Candidatus Rokubacteria bacterium]|nr:methyltransferase domain-containing protein [Candidatus Rokubacteria bacterium]